MEKIICIGIFILIVIVWFFKTVHIANENERFAVITLGKFTGFRGPGFILKWSGGENLWVRIKSGDRGEIISSQLCKINGIDLPIKINEPMKTGQFIRVTGFYNDMVLGSPDSIQTRELICEKCGHVNQVK